MRRPIGWVDKSWPGGRRSVRVEFFAETIRWRFRTKDAEVWEEGVVTPENWDVLEEKILELKQRGHLFDKELALVRRLRPPLLA